MSKKKDFPNPTDFDIYVWAMSVEQRLSKHEAYFKILGALGVATLTGIVGIILLLLR